MAGFYDIFFGTALKDFEALQSLDDAVGKVRHCLTIGPWHHWDWRSFGPVSLDGTLDFIRRHLLESNDDDGAHFDDESRRVRVHVRNCRKEDPWHFYSHFPPRNSAVQCWNIGADMTLLPPAEIPTSNTKHRNQSDYISYEYRPLDSPTPGTANLSPSSSSPLTHLDSPSEFL